MIYRCLAGLLIDRRGRGRDAAPPGVPGERSPGGRFAAGEPVPARGRSALGSASDGGVIPVPAVRVTFGAAPREFGSGLEPPRGWLAAAGRGRQRSPWGGVGWVSALPSALPSCRAPRSVEAEVGRT